LRIREDKGAGDGRTAAFEAAIGLREEEACVSENTSADNPYTEESMYLTTM